MEILKRGMALALALTVLSSAGAQAAGSAASTTTPETTVTPEPVVLKSVYEDKDQDFWPYVNEVIVLEKHGSLKTDQLPKTQVYLDAAGTKHQTDLKWTWSALDLQKAGSHQVSAEPVLTDPLTLAEGFDGKVTYPVFRKGTNAVLEVKALQQHELKDVLIAKDSKDPLSELTITTSGLRYSAGATGYILSTDQWKWDWDVSKVDTSTTGQATITGTLKDQPDWIKVAEADKTVEHTVYVMPDDGIYLTAPTSLTEEGKLTFQWIYDSQKVTKAVLEMEKDGVWTACDQSWYTYQMPTEEKTVDGKKVEAQPAALILDLTKIPAKETYTFRLNYVDETSGEAQDKTTDPLYITIPENVKELAAKAEGKIPAELKIGEKPEVKPEPEPEPEPEPDKDTQVETEIPKDIVTDTYITLSGKSLAEKIAQGKTVTFAMKGATLNIPSQLLSDLKLKDTDLITVAVTVPKTGTVQVVVNAGGNVITNLTGSVVKMSYTLASNKTLTCKDLTGTLSPKVTYDSKTKTASFPITKAGTYTLTPKTVTSTSTNKTTSTTKKTTTTTTKKNTTTTTTKKATTTNNATTNKTTVTATKPGTGTAIKTAGSTTTSTVRDQNDEQNIFMESGSDESGVMTASAEADTLLLEEAQDDAPRTMWDEQTPVALALIAVVGMLLAAGLLLRKWFSE